MSEREAERRELEAAGWERVERMGKTVWRNPESGHLYPQDVAIALVRKRAESADELEQLFDEGEA
jgi:hypothetical protein